jgi:hypothetical protein
MSAGLPMLMSPVGPVAEAFVNDWRLLTAIMGPVGSAKTTTCIRKCLAATRLQNIGPDGVRRARGAVIRDTYPQLRKTVLESWFTWFPKTKENWSGESPMTHKLRVDIPGGAPLELEMIFAAIGENKIEDVAKGWELTFAWLNEGDTLAREVRRFLLGRVGRFPGATLGGCAWRGIFEDFNAPDIDNHVYPVYVDQDMGLTPEIEEALREELGPLFGIGFHRQPGGRAKDAGGTRIGENLHNLPRGYYEQQMIGASSDYIRRMIDNEFGAVRNGLPVYPEFKDEMHVAKEPIRPVKGLPLDIGVDGGLTPAAVIGQQLPNGQKRVIDECVVWIDKDKQELAQIGPTAFGEHVGRHILMHYPDHDVRFVWCDPATSAGEGAMGDDRSWLQLFSAALFKTLGKRGKALRAPVKGNSIDRRLEAVRGPLSRLIEGQPEYLLSPVCKSNRRGKNNGYVYRRTGLAGGDDRYVNTPVKNQYSHEQDAEQYLFCGWITSRAEYQNFRGYGQSYGQNRQIKHETDYAIFGD